MPLTREYVKVLQEIVRRLRKLERTTSNIELDIRELKDITSALDNEENILDWSSNQWKNFLTPFILEHIRTGGGSTNISKHDHTTDTSGGDAFARKGAALVEEEPNQNP